MRWAEHAAGKKEERFAINILLEKLKVIVDFGVQSVD
jgi:hypothetical protein